MGFERKKTSVEELEKKAEKLAEEYKVTDLEDKIERFIDEYKTINPEGSDEDIRVRAYNRFILSMKGKKARNLQDVKAVLFSKRPAYDFAQKPRQDAQDYVEKYGKEKAIEDGYVNQKGDFLYTTPKWKKGNVIPEHEYSSTAYGVFKLENDDAPKYGELHLSGSQAIDFLPLYEEVEFEGRINKNKSTAKFYDIYLSSEVRSNGKKVEFWDFSEILDSAIPERFISSFDDLVVYLDQGVNGKDNWCLVQCEIIDIGMVDNTDESKNVPVTLSDPESITSDSYTFWAEPELAKSIKGELFPDAIVSLRPYKKKDGTISGQIWSVFAPELMEAEEAEDLDELEEAW